MKRRRFLTLIIALLMVVGSGAGNVPSAKDKDLALRRDCSKRRFGAG